MRLSSVNILPAVSSVLVVMTVSVGNSARTPSSTDLSMISADSRCSATTAARTASPTAHGKCRSLDVPFAIRSGAVNFWATAAAHLAAFMAVSVPSTPTTTGLALSVTTNPLQSTQSTLVSTDDDDGSLRRLGDLCADRAQQHPAEPASAVAANDNELGPLGFVDQPVGGPVADNSSLHVHVGISFLPTGQPFGQYLVPLILVLLPTHADDGVYADITPRMQRNEVDLPPGRFVER